MKIENTNREVLMIIEENIGKQVLVRVHTMSGIQFNYSGLLDYVVRGSDDNEPLFLVSRSGGIELNFGLSAVRCLYCGPSRQLTISLE